MQKIIELWKSATQIEGANWVIGISGVLIFGLIGYYVITLLRQMATGDTGETEDLMSEFQQLKTEGKLTDEEYERIRASTPLSGTAQELLNRPVREDLKPGDSSDSVVPKEPALPPPRRLTPEEAEAIREKLAQRAAQRGRADDETDDTSEDADGTG